MSLIGFGAGFDTDKRSSELLYLGYQVLEVKQKPKQIELNCNPVQNTNTTSSTTEISSIYTTPAKTSESLISSDNLNIIIFSKDRPCQLELLLRSIKLFLKQWQIYRSYILYTYSELTYRDGYEKIKLIHPEFKYVCENDYSMRFKQNVLNFVKDTNCYTMFLVDDNVFRQECDLNNETFQIFSQNKDIICLSLRLCPRINYCYSVNRISPPPKFESNLIWNWQETHSNTDWGYPMSLDGHIFRTEEIKNLIIEIDFTNPNSLESGLAALSIKPPKMICFPDSKVINIPANRVQNSHLNRHGSLMTPADLNTNFLNDKIILLKIS